MRGFFSRTSHHCSTRANAVPADPGVVHMAGLSSTRALFLISATGQMKEESRSNIPRMDEPTSPPTASEVFLKTEQGEAPPDCHGGQMAQWKPLPPGIAPSVRELVVRLRELTEQAGISTAELARKSTYRRAAWARWLNGRAVPPRPTVEVFGSIAGLHGTELARLLSLRDVAERIDSH